MKTVEISDQQHALLERLRSDERLRTLDSSWLLFIVLITSNPLDIFEKNWKQVQRTMPSFPDWEDIRAIIANQVGPIRSTPGVMGGVACIGNSRIPVWVLVSLKKQGLNDGDLLRAYPSLQASDLEAAWSYYTVNSDTVDEYIQAQLAEDQVG